MGAAREEELVGQPVLRFLRPDYQEVVLARIRRMQETGMPVEPIETQILCLDGRTIDVEMTGMPVTYLGRHVILTVIWDIHDRKQAGEKLEASLREKELLLKEIHHRVKNNLQIISSLLSLQTASTMSEEASDVLIESRNRIRSMALIHEKLYMSSDFSCIDFKEYIDSLIGSLFRSYVTARDVRIVRDIEDVSLDIDAAIPCGLIINELITNSLKYAFKDSAGHELRVSLKACDGVYTLIVGDDGVGLPPGLDFRNTPTLGLQLVVTLTGQLNGNIERLEGKGTTFRITFREKTS
jgi:two-component sensor histidine kinase